MREDGWTKARRYVSEGRLIVERVVGDQVKARCRGGGSVYRLSFDGRRWQCSCPAVSDSCCHLNALRLVTAPDKRRSEGMD
jgi:hypothetical protein